MNDTYCTKIIDLQIKNPTSPIHAKKGDTARKIRFLLFDGSAPYTMSSDCYAVFTAQKPDGNILYNACEIENNSITYTFTAQTCSVAGSMDCEMRLYGADDKLITSSRFQIEVEDTVFSDGDTVESTAEVSALTGLISETTALISDVEQKLADNAYADAHSAICYTAQDLTEEQKIRARENISAAPAGYGIGEARTTKMVVSSYDEITAGGIWTLPAAFAPQQTNGDWQCFAMPNYYGNGMILIATQSYQTMAHMAVKQMYNGTWGEWEWLNPPMAPGVEYRTTERWNSKAVYTKLINCGTMPNASNANINGLTPDMQIVDFSVVFIREGGNTFKLPHFDPSGNIYARAQCLPGSYVIQIQTFSDMSAYTGYATVKYTKN